MHIKDWGYLALKTFTPHTEAYNTFQTLIQKLHNIIMITHPSPFPKQNSQTYKITSNKLILQIFSVRVYQIIESFMLLSDKIAQFYMNQQPFVGLFILTCVVESMAGPRGEQTGIKYDSYNIRCRVLVIIWTTSLKLLEWRSNWSLFKGFRRVEDRRTTHEQQLFFSSVQRTIDLQSEKLKQRDVIMM